MLFQLLFRFLWKSLVRGSEFLLFVTYTFCWFVKAFQYFVSNFPSVFVFCTRILKFLVNVHFLHRNDLIIFYKTEFFAIYNFASY